MRFKALLTSLFAVLALAACSGEASDPNAAGWEKQVETTQGLSQEHTAEKVDYPTKPPAGGAHSAQWQNCGLYDYPVVDEAAVHSLEHGAVWFTWQGALTQNQRSFIAELAGNSEFVLATPYPEQEAPFTLTAWGLQLKLNSFEREVISGFVEKYANGPQNPEPGAPCMQGINTRR